MNTSDNATRSGRPSIAAYRGQGVNVRFLCARCSTPSQQLGSKLRHFKGLRQRVCAKCDEEMKR